MAPTARRCLQSRRCNYGCVRCASSVNGGPCATSFSLVVRANVSVSVVQNSNRDRYIDCALSAPCALLQYRILSPAQPPLTGWRGLVSHENRSAGFMLLWRGTIGFNISVCYQHTYVSSAASQTRSRVSCVLSREWSGLALGGMRRPRLGVVFVSLSFSPSER